MQRIASAAVVLLVAATPALARAVDMLALDGANTLLRFDTARPEVVTAATITGLTGTLIGIDYRPANRRLYGVSDSNDVYTIDRATAVAKSVATLTMAFDGGPRSGFDFNPQADRLRLVGASGQNLRVNVDLGAAAVDVPLRYAPNDRNAGKRPAIAAAAYTNSVADAPTTKLFDIDAELDVLALQDPPNDGVLVTVGPLGVDFAPLAGFDIVTEGGSDRGFACSGSTLYEIDLATGAARRLGIIGAEPAKGLIGLAAVPGGAPD